MGFPKKSFVVVLALSMLALSATMAWATANEYRQRGTVPCGVSVEGENIGGMTAEEAKTVIERTVTDPLSRPVVVSSPKGTKTFDPGDIVAVDYEAMLDDAYDPRASATFSRRIACSFGQPLEHEVKPQFSVDDAAIASWVASLAADIDLPARDADVEAEDGELVWSDEREGRKVQRTAAAAAIAKAVASDDRELTLPLKKLKPKVTMKDLGPVIVIDQSERSLRVFEQKKQLREWPVAVGQPSFPTPLGEHKIELKRYMPTWTNPGSDWARGMPAYIGPGYSNPLGLRALNLNAAGIRIHGTTSIGSLGTAASHGCIRMANSDVVVLYDMVEVGTPVFIVR